MRILVDTNIILDIFTKREPWFADSYYALTQTLKDENNECLFSASSVTDVFYLMHKALHNNEEARKVIEKMCQVFIIPDVQAVDIQSALNSQMKDFEDAVMDSVASRHKASYILTRNSKDFAGSIVPAITPEQYNLQFYPGNV